MLAGRQISVANRSSSAPCFHAMLSLLNALKQRRGLGLAAPPTDPSRGGRTEEQPDEEAEEKRVASVKACQLLVFRSLEPSET